jgi:hypothetical protein
MENGHLSGKVGGLMGMPHKTLHQNVSGWHGGKIIHTVAVALQNNRWMRGLRRMNSEIALRQYVELWTQLSQVQLGDAEDSIVWRFTPDGKYSASSAYKIQFTGSTADIRWATIWKAKVEQKCRIFMWLMLQNRLPTVDRIIKWGGQADPICKLCHTTAESTIHLFANNSFAASIRQSTTTWYQMQMPATRTFTPCSLGLSATSQQYFSLRTNQPPATRQQYFSVRTNQHQPSATSQPNKLSVRQWWRLILRAGAVDMETHVQVIIYTVWNLWKM